MVTAGAAWQAVPPGRWPSMLQRFRRLGILEQLSLAGVALLTLTAAAAPALAPHSATAITGAPLSPPGVHALLGTDELGRDVFSRVLFGMRESWFSALAVVASGVLFGGAVGLAAGVSGGLADIILMRITDAGLALPGPILAIAVVIALGPGLLHTLIAVAVLWWPYYARIVRGEARALAVRPHVDAARLSGSRHVRLAVRHVMPGLLPPVLVAASLDLGGLILTLAGLSFLGLGAPPPSPELGAMAAQGLDSLFSYPWVPLAPAAAVFLLAVTASLAGDGLRDLLDTA
jgi:peptide/nickel transport system permease protein